MAAPQLGEGGKPSATPASSPWGRWQGWDMGLGLTWGETAARAAKPR